MIRLICLKSTTKATGIILVCLLLIWNISQPAFIYLLKVNYGNIWKMCSTCSELTIRQQNDVTDVVQVSLLLTLNRFYTLLWCFHCCLWRSKYQLGYVYFSSYLHQCNVLTNNLNPFLTNGLILYPLKTFGFLVFSGGMKWQHWPEMGKTSQWLLG